MFTLRCLHAALICAIPIEASAADPFEWTTASPESQGLSSAKLEALQTALAGQKTRAFLVVRNDKIVSEWYADGQSAATKQGTASLAKAIVGGLSFAVANNDGLIALDDPAWKYVPQWKGDPQRSTITVRHLGSHTSGIDDSHNREERARGVDQGSYTGWSGEFWRWRQGKQRPPNDAFSISRDTAPMLFEPGKGFQYSNPGIAMLSYCVTASIKGTKHADVRTLLRERIMRPIGVKDDEWSVGYGQTEVVEGLPMVANWGGGNYTPRAAARIGRLVLRRGDWSGEPLLSAQSVAAMTGDAGLPGHCGVGWWTNGDGRYEGMPRDAVWGAGAGHQILLVVPSLNLIAVRNGGELPLERVADQDKRFHEAVYVNLFKPLMEAVNGGATNTSGLRLDARPPYPPSPVIRGIEFDFKTHRRLAPGSDNWPITWADDNHQYTAWGDGGGFGGTNSNGRVLLGVARIEGDGTSYVGKNVWGGFEPENPVQFDGKSYGMLCVDGVLYMWRAFQPNPHLSTCELLWSADHGAHWQPADWSFRYEDGLTVPTFLNFGRNYEGARDDYVYSYYIQPTWGPGRSTTGNYGFDVHRPGKLYLSRVPKKDILRRERYEFFAGIDDEGQPRWTSDLAQKAPVFQDPNGVGWNLSASFARPLNRYLLSTEHTATHVGKMGMFDAPAPWGPWTTVAYEDAWGEGHVEVSAFYWSVPNKWLRDDGRFTLAFSGKNSNDSWNTVEGRFVTNSNTLAVPLDARPPYPPSKVITGIEWAPRESIVRAAKGSDNWPLTWADDDNLYGAYGDGNGFQPFTEKKLSLGLARISGSPGDFQGVNLRSPMAEQLGEGPKGKKTSGIVMVEGVLYMWVRNAGNSQLAWSDDHGKTWSWADWKWTTSFGAPTFLNFGRNYAGARDNFVYVYSTDSNSAYEPSDRMVLARVPKGRLRDRHAYEFFVELNAQGSPRWTKAIEDRGAVFQHPGRCYRTGITYNAALKRYVWCHVFPESTDSRGPRFQGGFGVFDAPEPWGPWTTVFFTNEWDVGPGETNSFPTKWMSADGRTLHLVFSGDDWFSIRRANLTAAD